MERRAVIHPSGVVLIMACLMGLSACGDKEPFEKPPVPVKVQPVEASLPETALKFSATLVPREQVDLAFKVGGYVHEILKLTGTDGVVRDVQKGDKIGKGTVLATLRESDYQVRLNQAKSALEEARASLAQAVREFERAERLLQADVMAKNDYDRAKEKLDLAKARLSGAESQVEEAKIQLQDTVIRSPLDCLVVSRLVERGSLVGPGAKGFVLADLSSVKAVFGVPDYVLKLVKRGDNLTTVVEALHNREFSGVVTAISPSADPRSRVFEVEITIANEDLQLRDGMIATVSLSGKRAEAIVPVVPLQSVVRPPGDSEGFMVYVLEETDGRKVARGRKVKIGSVHGNKVVITEGVEVGERVITRGATIVYDNAVVTIIH
jgi:RND family efflux transporter MFP subunit